MAIRGLPAIALGTVAVMVLSVLAFPAGGQPAQGPLYELADPRGDIILRTPGAPDQGVPPQAGAATDGMDLTAFRILDETDRDLILEFEFVDLLAPHTNVEGFGTYALWMRFQVDGHAAYYHLLVTYWDSFWFHLGQMPDIYLPVQLCIHPQPDPPRDFVFFLPGCSYQSAIGRALFTQDVLQVRLPKLALLGLAGNDATPPPGVPKALPVGTELTGIHVESVKRQTVPFWFFGPIFPTPRYHDPAPNGGQAPSYALTKPTAGTNILLSAATSAPAYTLLIDDSQDPFMAPFRRTVALGETGTTLIPIQVLNRADTKRLVNLTVEWPSPVPGITARLAPTVEVPSQDHRTVNLVLTVDRPLEHRQSVELVVHATSLGHVHEIDTLWLDLIGSRPPTPERNILRFHAQSERDGDLEAGPFLLCITYCTWYDRLWMNTLDEDPLATADVVEQYGYLSFGTGTWPLFQTGASLDVPLASPLRFDTSSPVDATIRLSVDRAVDGRLAVTLGASVPVDDCDQPPCRDHVILATLQRQVRLEPTPQNVEFALPIPPDLADVLVPGSRLTMMIQFFQADTLGTTLGVANQYRFHVDESRIELPLVAIADEDAPALSTIGLRAVGGGEEFLNPGKTRALYVVAVQEGPDPQRVRLTADAQDARWSVRLVPGTTYDLGPGQSVNVTVLVTAPADADEGEVGRITLQARGASDETLSRTITLRAIATRGIEIHDEAATARIDPDTAARTVADEGGESPALLAPLVLVTALAALAAARRRR